MIEVCPLCETPPRESNNASKSSQGPFPGPIDTRAPKARDEGWVTPQNSADKRPSSALTGMPLPGANAKSRSKISPQGLFLE